MTTLLISDLHLAASRAEIGKQFTDLLNGEAREAEALYILGDLFDAWLGDDDPDPYFGEIKTALRELVDSGVPAYFMHGNRDFMIGDVFAEQTGVSILADPAVVNLYGQDVLLCHGDALCTDDVHYQALRAMTRDPEWQAMMRRKSIAERVAIAAEARQESIARGASISEAIMDVNQAAVVATLREHDIAMMLHGHTHRPAVHAVDLGDRKATRIVLGDWYQQGSVVRWDENGPRLETLPRR